METLSYRFPFSPEGPDFFTLSQAIQSVPPSHSKSLKYPSSEITSIGAFSTPLKNITSLDLSTNKITLLKGIESFQNLKSLDLRSNLITDITALAPLMSLKQLESVQLARNPITTRPLYKLFIIYNSPSITSINSTLVSSKDRSSAEMIIPKIESLAKTLISNEKVLLKLDSLKRKLRLHRELILGNYLEKYIGINSARSLPLIKLRYFSETKQRIREWVYVRTDDLGIAYKRKQWDSIWNECLSVQNEKIYSNTEDCESLAEECVMIYENKYSAESVRKSFNFDVRNSSVMTKRSTRDNSQINAMDYRLMLIKNKNQNRNAIHTAIREGLNAVVTRFRKIKLIEKGFDLLKRTVSIRKAEKRTENSSKEKNPSKNQVDIKSDKAKRNMPGKPTNEKKTFGEHRNLRSHYERNMKTRTMSEKEDILQQKLLTFLETQRIKSLSIVLNKMKAPVKPKTAKPYRAILQCIISQRSKKVKLQCFLTLKAYKNSLNSVHYLLSSEKKSHQKPPSYLRAPSAIIPTTATLLNSSITNCRTPLKNRAQTPDRFRSNPTYIKTRYIEEPSYRQRLKIDWALEREVGYGLVNEIRHRLDSLELRLLMRPTRK